MTDLLYRYVDLTDGHNLLTQIQGFETKRRNSSLIRPITMKKPDCFHYTLLHKTTNKL